MKRKVLSLSLVFAILVRCRFAEIRPSIGWLLLLLLLLLPLREVEISQTCVQGVLPAMNNGSYANIR